MDDMDITNESIEECRETLIQLIERNMAKKDKEEALNALAFLEEAIYRPFTY